MNEDRPAKCESRYARIAAAIFISLLFGSDQSSHADLIKTKNGQTFECEIVEDLGKAYRLRTHIGVVDLNKDDIARHKKQTSPWQLYRERRKKCPKTAQAHYELAMWCDARDLGPERADELEHALTLDSDHGPTREALGYERNDRGDWVRSPSKHAPDPADVAASRAQAAQERLIRKIISQWFVKVRAIHDSQMSPRRGPVNRKKFRTARENILKIQDPLAIPALTGVMSSGNRASRLVLVEALSQFSDDDATMNLVVMSVLDPSKHVRRAAAEELKRRDDPRVVERLRDALFSDEEGILRHAATALGVMSAVETVPDLIEQLSTEVPGIVRHSRAVSIGDIYGTFSGYSQYVHGRRVIRYHPGDIGVLGPGTLVGTRTYYQQAMVSVYRTEVQEALIAITGENFGFDRRKWIEWWDQNKPRR